MSKKHVLIILGVLITLVSLPIAIIAEVGFNGCCGAPTTGREGYGYMIGAGLLIVGVYLIVLARKK